MEPEASHWKPVYGWLLGGLGVALLYYGFTSANPPANHRPEAPGTKVTSANAKPRYQINA